MRISDGLVQEIVRRTVRVSQPERLIIFGPAARREFSPDSDIDLLVILPSARDTRTERIRIREELCGLGHAFDVIVTTTDRFEETKNVIGGISYPAHKHGRVIYEAA